MGREINNLKTTSTLVDGISADYASFQVDYPESVVDLRGDEVKMVCFKREGIIGTIQMRADRYNSISASDFDHLVKSFRITQ